MQFLVIAYDGKDSEAPARRQTARSAHIQLGNEMRDRGELLYAVAILDEQKAMVGSVMVLNMESRSALDAWLSREPYVTGKVWEKIEVKLCQIGPSFGGQTHRKESP